MPRTLLLIVALLILSAPCAWAERPNVILVMADDISPREFAAYDSRGAATPTIDDLARKGVQFQTAWATPKCQSTRALLMTGRYAYQTQWYHGSMRPHRRDDNANLYTKHRIFSQIMRQGGYASALIGKYQLGGDPLRYGFDQLVLTGERGGPEGYGKMIENPKRPGKRKPACYWHPYVALYNHPSTEQQVKWRKSKPSEFGPDVELHYMLEFIRRSKRQGKPFLLYHTSHLGNKGGAGGKGKGGGGKGGGRKQRGASFPAPPERDADGKPTGRRMPGTMASHVKYLDYIVKALQQECKKLGILKNTIIIVTTDNGSSQYGKDEVTKERGSRVPLWIAGPGVKPMGKVMTLTDFSDIFPTLAELAGVELKDYKVDGKSLWPYLSGKTKTHRRWIYSNLLIHQMVRTKALVRDGKGDFWQTRGSVTEEQWVKVTAFDTEELKRHKQLIDSVLKRFPAPSKDDPRYQRYLEKSKDKGGKRGKSDKGEKRKRDREGKRDRDRDNEDH